MEIADRRLFEDTVRGIATTRTGADLDAALADIGWRDALIDDPTIAAVMFAVQGEFCVSSSAIDDVIAVTLNVEPDAMTCVVLPAIGSQAAPATSAAGRVVVRGVGSRRLLDAENVLLVVAQDDGHIATRVATSDLELRPVTGIDPAAGWVEVTGDLAAPTSGTESLVPWSAAIIAGQLAVASELVANSRAMLGLARDHAVEREQFGVPIASFQAVRHRLAESLYAVESAEAAVDASWEDQDSYTAAIAKAIAGRSAKTVARHAQQVLAGMGFTSEHRFHHYFRRSIVLDQLFGSSAHLSEAIGADVLRSRTLPPVRPL